MTRPTQAEQFYGGAHYISTLIDFGIRWGQGRVITFESSVPGASCVLPDARIVQSPGWPTFFIIVPATSVAIALKARGGPTLQTIQPGTMTSVALIDGSTETGVWCVWGEGDPRDYLGVFYGDTGDVDVLRRYDPTTSAWDTGAAFTRDHRQWATAFTLSDGSYVVGDDSNPGSENDRYTIDTWTARTARGEDCQFSPGAVDADLAYMFSSGLTNNLADRQSDRYDKTGDSWASRTDTPQTVAYGIIGSPEAGKILVGLGSGGFGNDDGELREYDTAGDSYSSLPDHPVSNDYHHSASFQLEGRVHQVGGSININQAALDTHFAFTLTGSTWSTLTSFPQPIKYAAGALDIETEVGFVCGGSDAGGSPENQLRSYTFDGFRTLGNAPDDWGGEVQNLMTGIAK